MSAGPFRLPLDRAIALATKVISYISPVCEPGYCIAAGAVRRRCVLVGDLDIVCIPKFTRGMFGDPGMSQLTLQLNKLENNGALIRAAKNGGSKLYKFYDPDLFRDNICFKIEINVADSDNWPVLLAIKTGPAEFSHRLVSHSDNAVRGFLPRGWRIADGWQVWNDRGERVMFESERAFLEQFCGAWVEPEAR